MLILLCDFCFFFSFSRFFRLIWNFEGADGLGRGFMGCAGSAGGFSGGDDHSVAPVSVCGCWLPLILAKTGDSGVGSIMGEGVLWGSGGVGWVPMGAVPPWVWLVWRFIVQGCRDPGGGAAAAAAAAFDNAIVANMASPEGVFPVLFLMVSCFMSAWGFSNGQSIGDFEGCGAGAKNVTLISSDKENSQGIPF